MLDLLIPTIAQGLLWSLLALGVYITFRVLDIADLSVEGTFRLELLLRLPASPPVIPWLRLLCLLFLPGVSLVQ